VTRALPACVLAVALLAAVALVPPVDLPGRGVDATGDVAHYERIAGRIAGGGVPYRDVRFEYPPAALVPLLLPEALPGRYQPAFRWTMWAATCAAALVLLLLLARLGAGRGRLLAAAAFVGLAPLALPNVFFDRFDAWPALLLLLALTAVAAGRDRVGAGVLALATTAKVYPALALPPLLLRGGRPATRRLLGVFAAVAAAVLLPFALLGPHGAADAVGTLLRRPLHVESLGGSVLLALDRAGLYDARVFLSGGGSQDLGGTLPAAVAGAQTALLVLVLLLLWAGLARAPVRPADVAAASAAGVAAFVALGKVLSPQFLVWLVLLVPLAAARRWIVALVLAAGALALTRAYYPYRYEDVLRGGDAAFLLLARDVVLVALAAVLVAAAAPGIVRELRARLLRLLGVDARAAALVADVRSGLRFRRLFQPLYSSRPAPGSTEAVPLRLTPLGGGRVLVRPGTSDGEVVLETFAGLYHLPPVELGPRPLVWDLGSNIGLTIADLAVRYPDARILGVELDPGNAAICRANVEPWCDRVELLEAAVWVSDGEVSFAAERGNEYGVRVVSGEEAGGLRARAISLDTLAALDPRPVDYVKMDVEGAEREILAAGGAWAERGRRRDPPQLDPMESE
jgi:FkbM family methyltransferase